MNSDKNKTLETSLVLTTGFLLVFLLTKISFFLYLSFTLGVIGIFVRPLAKLISIAWFKLADFLNYVMSRVLLGTVFFVILLPISLIYRLTNSDKLHLSNRSASTWNERNKKYKGADLENIW